MRGPVEGVENTYDFLVEACYEEVDLGRVYVRCLRHIDHSSDRRCRGHYHGVGDKYMPRTMEKGFVVYIRVISILRAMEN